MTQPFPQREIAVLELHPHAVAGKSIPLQDKAPIWILAGLLGYTILRAVAAAMYTPFWGDEVITYVLAHQPSWRATLEALKSGADSPPPLFYLIERLFSGLPIQPEVALRLPSIFGFCATLSLVFVFVRKIAGGWWGSLCAAMLLLTPMFQVIPISDMAVVPYALDARPYSLVLACIALALVAYQRVSSTDRAGRSDGGRWAVLMAVGLAGATAFHYFAVLAFLPFALAECVRIARQRNVRWSVWGAMAFGVVPILFSLPMLLEIRRLFGSDFWAQASWLGSAQTYGRLFHVGAPIGLGLAACLVIGVLRDWGVGRIRSGSYPTKNGTDFIEYILIFGLLVTPFTAAAISKIMHSGMTTRYLLFTLLGLPLGVGSLARHFGARARVLMFLFLLAAVGFQEASFWSSRPHVFSSDASVVESSPIVTRAKGLPLVMTSILPYLPVAHYAAPELAQRLYYLIDKAKARALTGTDNIDMYLPILGRYTPLNVPEADRFLGEHSKFLLYAAPSDWWPSELIRMGCSLQLVAELGSRQLYLVDHQ